MKPSLFSKVVFSAASFLLIGIAFNASAVTVGPNPILTGGTITEFLEEILLHLQNVIAYLAVLFLAIGGVLYISSGGSQGMLTAAKLCIVGAILGIALAAAGPSFLRQILIVVYGSPTPIIPTDLGLAPTIAQITENTLSFLLSIIGMLAIIGLAVSSILYLSAGGDPSQAERAKQAMKYSIIGIAVAGASLIIVTQIVRFFS
jgi:hypothetical protein